MTEHLRNQFRNIFFSEKSETYVDIDDNLLILRDGKTILRTSEFDGYNHIYAIDFTGKSTQLTKGKWDVIAFHGISEEEGKLYYSSAENGTTTKSLYKIDLKGENKQLISEKSGYCHAEFTSGMKYFVKSYSTLNSPTIFTLCTNDGATLKVLESNEALITKLNNLHLPKKEFITFQSGSYELNAWMLKPANFDPLKKYPVYLTIYCGPGHNEVLDQWSGQNYMYHQLLAQKGYIVVSVDSRGTQYRGATFKKSTYLQLGKLETEDILNVAAELKKLPFVEAERIGIQGWSFGGFMTSLAMTKGKGAFKMGIAVAPVTNWKWYDNIYTERFMRTPAENQAGYDDNSP